MAAQQPYTDIETVKAFMGSAACDSSTDAFLGVIIPMVKAFIDKYTGRSFGWGDVDSENSLLDSATTDYSNSDAIGIASYAIAGTLLTIVTNSPAPWVVGNTISLYGFGTNLAAYNGVWTVTAAPNAVTFTVDISASAGTLSVSNTSYTPDGTSFKGYVGNYVQNYKYCKQESYDGTQGNVIWLRNMDIRSIDSVYLGMNNINTPTILNHNQYFWRDDGRLMIGGAYFNAYNSEAYGNNGADDFGGIGYQTITVSYWCGHIGVPPEIQLAALDLVQAYYTLRKSQGVQMERVGDYQIQYDLSFRKLLQTQPDNLNTLNMYRKRHV